jgi:hypothetical protein
LGGISYLLGIVFYINSFTKFKEIFSEGGGSQQKGIVPVAYFITGSALLFLPSMMQAVSYTFFGSGYSILAYSSATQYDIYHSVSMLIQTAGILWFMRGCVLLAHASDPEQGQAGSKGHGPKGFLLLVAGIFGINIDKTINFLDYVVTHMMSYFSGGAGG